MRLRVSMPYTGLFQFLQNGHRGIRSRGGVSMPYTGLFQFLQTVNDYVNKYVLPVSMPYTGLFQFLRKEVPGERRYCFRVSMPYTGLFQFLRSPPKNSLFSLFFRGVFTRNCLNILIYPVIVLFFGLFIVLTYSVLFLFDFGLLASTK